MRTTAVLASDTSLEAERTQVELWRRMSTIEKLHAVSESTQAVLQRWLAGIRGRELACQAFPEAARLRGR